MSLLLLFQHRARNRYHGVRARCFAFKTTDQFDSSDVVFAAEWLKLFLIRGRAFYIYRPLCHPSELP